MTMSDEDRIQLMLLVKEGKISVQEAVDTVRHYYSSLTTRAPRRKSSFSVSRFRSLTPNQPFQDIFIPIHSIVGLFRHTHCKVPLSSGTFP